MIDDKKEEKKEDIKDNMEDSKKIIANIIMISPRSDILKKLKSVSKTNNIDISSFVENIVIDWFEKQKNKKKEENKKITKEKTIDNIEKRSEKIESLMTNVKVENTNIRKDLRKLKI